ncbi:MAG: fibronectin type III domain-containing protein [Acidobacteriota bacterium]
MNRSASFFLVIACHIVLSSSAPASELSADDRLADRAELIVSGTVLAVDPLAGPKWDQTEYLIEVDTVLQGSLTHSPIVVRVPGEISLDGDWTIRGSELFMKGQRTVLFLQGSRSDGMVLELIDGVRGAFHVFSFAGREVAYPTFWPSREPYPADAALASPEPLRDLARFTSWLRGRAARPDRTADYRLTWTTENLAQASASKPSVELKRQGSTVAEKAVPAGANLTDPSGDARSGGQPDLIAGSLSSNGSSMTFRSQYETNSFNPVNARTFFYIDIDSDISTGLPAHFGEDPRTLGTEYIIQIFDGEAEVRRHNPNLPPGGSQVDIIANEPATTLGDGHLVTLDTDLLGDDTLFSFKVTVDQFFDPTFTSFTDYMPNFDAPAAMTRETPTSPTAPSGLQAVAAAEDRVELSWTDNADNELSFDLQRSTAGGSYQSIAILAADVTSAVDDRASPATSYSYRVRARNDSGVSDFSNEASVTTPGQAAPTGLTATAISTSEIQLAWSDNADMETGYEVEIASDGGAFVLVQSLPADAESTTVAELTEATAYTFRVRGTTDTGSTGYSNEASATTFGQAGDPCVADASTLCLNNGRFELVVEWEDFIGIRGGARDAGLISPDSALLYFFDETNWEMLVKVLDGCDINGHFWVFSAATTNVAYSLSVRDTATGIIKQYTNALGNDAEALTDTEAFATCAADFEPAALGLVEPPKAAAIPQPIGSCTADDASLCLNQGRYRVSVNWATEEGTGAGSADAYRSADSGMFWFFSPNNVEMLVKVLDGCEINDRVWVFAAASTDVGYTLRVLDTVTGAERTYSNAPGTPAPAITDTGAFLGCE